MTDGRASGQRSCSTSRNFFGAASLEEILEDKLTEEAKDIKELEEHLRKRKRTLRAAINQMPPERRSRIENNLTPLSDTTTIAECVVCHTSSMTPL